MTVLDLLLFYKKASFWYHLLSLRNSRPSLLYKRFQGTPFISPVIISAADYWTFEPIKGLS